MNEGEVMGEMEVEDDRLANPLRIDDVWISRGSGGRFRVER